MKRTILLFINILFITSLFAQLPTPTLTLDDVYFNKETETITGYKGSLDVFIIPERKYIKGKNVPISVMVDRAIEKKGVKWVELPSSLIRIEEMAFAKNQIGLNHNYFIIPEGVVSIGPFAFWYNNIGSKLTLPTTLTEISGGAFNQNNITLVNNFDTKGIIYARKADGSENNSIIVSYGGTSPDIDFIPRNVTTIGYNAFTYNTLGKVEIPWDVSIIKESAFWACTIDELTMENVRIIENDAFRYNDISTLTIPKSVVSIGKRAFQNNLYLTTIITENTTGGGSLDIGPYAFANNPTNDITFGNTVRHIGNGAFIGCREKAFYTLNIPDNVISIGDSAFYNYEFVEKIVIGNGVEKIGNYAFADIKTEGILETTQLSLGTGLKEIGSHAFYNGYIKSLTVPGNVKSIGFAAFQYNDISSLILETGVQYIEISAFQNNLLYNLFGDPFDGLPNTVYYLGSNAFADNGLISIDLPDPVIRPGYVFLEWQYFFGEQTVTEITDFSESYKAAFNATPYTVSGTVNGTDNVSVSITGKIQDGRIADTVINVQNDGGTYELTTYYGDRLTITPSKTGYQFTPEKIIIEEVQGEISNQNFIAENESAKYTVSGYIYGADTVIVTISGDISDSQVIFDQYLGYEFKVEEGSDITITAAKDGYLFLPSDTSFSDIQNSVSGINFYAFQYFTISGVITGTSDVDIFMEDLDGNMLDFTSVSSDGETYSFTVFADESVIVYPSKEGFVFDPPHIQYDLISGNLVNQDYTGSQAVSIHQDYLNEIKTFPNPTSNFISIQLPGDVHNYNKIVISDLKGKTVDKYNIKSTFINIDLTSYAPGIYLLNILGDDRIYQTKIIKE